MSEKVKVVKVMSEKVKVYTNTDNLKHRAVLCYNSNRLKHKKSSNSDSLYSYAISVLERH